MAKSKQALTINGDETPGFADSDPKNLNGRLYDAMSRLLDTFDDMTVREQVATVSAIARIQMTWIKIRENANATANSGTTVKRYEKAFAANATRKRKPLARPDFDGLLGDDELEY